MSAFRPDTEAQLVEIVRQAVADRRQLAPVGLGSKTGLGSAVEHQRLDLSSLSGIVAYEPEELVLTVRAGTPVAEVEALLAAHNQHLAFEPLDFAPLYGTGAGTVGGLVATNLSGPRRLRAGAVRDHVLGIRAVSGKGEVFKAGGRVVKNVTGYDLPRGLCGSFGRLALFTEVTLKVLPRPELETTLVLQGGDDRRAVEVLCAAMGARHDVSSAAYLPAGIAASLGLEGAVTLIRVEGFARSVEARLSALATEPYTNAPQMRLEGDASATLWRQLRDAAPLAGEQQAALWRVSVAPTAGPAIVAAMPRSPYYLDWSGGLVWIATDATPVCASRLRHAIAEAGGGHATLMRAPEDLRRQVAVLEPQSPVMAGLLGRLAAEFDPRAILNPGRF